MRSRGRLPPSQTRGAGNPSHFPHGNTSNFPPSNTNNFPPGNINNFPPGNTSNYPPGNTSNFPLGSASNFPLGNAGSYPLTLGFNQYSQSQQNHRGGFRGPAQNFNNKPNRRGRIRLRQPGYSFYSDDSNYSSNTVGSRGGGIINAAMKNLPKKPPLNEMRNNGVRERERVPSRADNNRSDMDRNNPQNKENRNQSRTRLDSETESQYKMYFCPKCREHYAYRQTQNRYIGKLPLILHCNHTMCQECVYQNLKNYKVNCSTCQTDSILTQEETPVCQTDMQNIFPPNFYILGVMFYSRPQGGYLGNVNNMKFVSTSSKKHPPSSVDPSDSCCFGACSKIATMYCPSCEGIYCIDCCTVLHKSTKKLMSHEPVPIRKSKFSLMLENCGEHSQMQVEFFCKTCDLTACCYCILENHTDHERVPLYHLNKTEMEEFTRLQKNAKKALKEVLCAQKKTARLVNFNTASIKKDVGQYFADCHAKLEILEKKISDELENFKGNNRGLDGVQSSLTASAEQLKQLVAFDHNKIGDKKLNLKGALDKLRDIENIPRFLVNENGNSEPIRFIVNTSSIEALDNTFVLEKCEDSEYRLMSEKDLPESYVINLDESDNEIEGDMSAIISQSNKSEDVTNVLSKLNDLPRMVSVSEANSASSKKMHKHSKPVEQKKKKLDMERVNVQHINSMDSFFIQYKNNQSRLIQLNKDIDNYVKMGGAQSVEQPQLNDLYLALYIIESHKEQRWCRARLTEVKNGESGPLYEMFFIDYGKTQNVDGTRIRDIPPFLAQKKPFAIECMLHNPMSVNWNKRAHYSLAKILNGKDVYMMVKSINSGIHEVDLMISSSDGGVTSVTDILVHATNSVGPINDDNVSMDGSLRREGYYPTLKVFPNSKKFMKNQKEKITIANVVDPYNIFIHLVQHQEAFKNMCHSIKKAYKNMKATGCIPIEGTYVLVEHKDAVRSNWHRAFIKSVDLNSDKVHVLLVDWGINVVVHTSKIKPLQECFTKLESQAVLVKMAHIAPYNTQATWSPQAANFLQGFQKPQDVLKMVVQDVENGVQVALFDITSNTDLCLNAMMVENNLADSTGPISTKLEWPHFDIKTPEFSDDEGLMASLLKKVDEQAYEDSDEEDYADLKKRQVDVVKVEAPDLIWVKFLEFRARESAMFKELQIHYSEEQHTKNYWYHGDQCVVELEHEFVRGKVLEKVSEEYKVYLYDKVKEITVPQERIFVYDKYFMKYPQAVIKSHLANIRPAGDTGKWSNSSIETLEEIFAKHKKIYAHKALEGDTELSKISLPLDMWYGLIVHGGPLDPDRLKYVSINNSLVKLGFAYKISTSVAPKPDEPATSAAPPVNTVKNGEDLLKILTGDIVKPSEEQSDKEEMSQINLEQEKHEENKPDSEEVIKSPKMDINKRKSPRKDRTTKSQCMKILESLNKPSAMTQRRKLVEPLKFDSVNTDLQDRTDSKKLEESLSEPKKVEDKEATEKEIDVERNIDDCDNKKWSAIVEEELGEPKIFQNINEDGELESGEGEDSPYHKSEVVINDWLPSFRLTQKDFQARVTCVETSGHLYIHEEDMDNIYYKMEANIKEYFDGNLPKVRDHQWEPGQLCTIKYTDGNWYRGKILRIKNPQEISVFMIDFGSDHDLSPDVLYREILYPDMGAFATKVKLDKVYAKSGSWLSSDYDHFHDLVTDWCRVVVNGPLDVELPLVEVYNENGVYVNQKLVELCPNLSRSSNFPIEQGGDEEDTVVIESIESEEPFANEMIMDNLDQELNERRSPWKEISLGTTINRNLKYEKRPIPEDLLDGKKVLLEIGGIISYDKVALKTPGEEVTEEMYNLVIDIQDAVELLPVLKDIDLDVPCLAPYSADGVWYRAKIFSIQAVSRGFVDVLFVDYGNLETVSVKDLRHIDPEYLKVPQQTWEAAINIVVKDETDVITITQFMNTLERKKRYIKVVKKEPLTVNIYDKDDKLSYQSLISNGSVKQLQQEDTT